MSKDDLKFWQEEKEVRAILCRDSSFFGTPVIDFDVLLNCLDDKTLVFLCCSSEKKAQHYQSVILEKCSEAQCVIINNYDEVYIDISGRCNLRCRSCQVANHHKESFSYSGRGLMSFELFCKILDKVQMELPYCLGVFLFNYGEPLLSPDLPRMIHEIHSRGMIAIISSNLSLEYNFDSLLIDPPYLDFHKRFTKQLIMVETYIW